MRVEDIPAHEADFDARGIDSNGKQFSLNKSSIAIPGETGRMKYTRIKPASGRERYYYRERYNKSQIVLHYTLGYLKSDIATLTRYNRQISVPFIIGRNGTIYNLFFSGFWSYHLGPDAIGGNKTMSQRTIGIEISNIGGLNLTRDGLSSYYRKIYCDLDQRNAYNQLNYRRFSYYASFTNAQYKSLITLIRYLTARYQIERKFLPEDTRYAFSNDTPEFNGIVSHVNYQRSAKEDVGPAFDWGKVTQEVMS